MLTTTNRLKRTKAILSILVMCGIFFYLGRYYSLEQLMTAFMRMAHRGPDGSSLRTLENVVGFPAIVGFHRLAIIDNTPNGDQPFFHPVKRNGLFDVSLCNGEIYNHALLRSKNRLRTASGSDCSVIYPLYKRFGLDRTVGMLDGDFAFVIIDSTKRQIHIGRDPVGVKPVFWGEGRNPGEIFVASEAKAIQPFCESVLMVPSGSTISFSILEDGNVRTLIRQYWSAIPRVFMECRGINEIVKPIRDSLTRAVRKRLMTERPLGLFISGGLDSSLVAGITRQLLGRDTRIQSFAIGMVGSPDLAKAETVAQYLGTEHHPVLFTPEDGIAVLKDVVRQLETFDITTIRASIPQYLLSRYIQKNTSVRVLLSGEGSDELFGGYLYFHRSPSNEAFQEDTQRLIMQLEEFDVLRVDRTTSGNGLEVRVPFLDRSFIRQVLSIPPEYKNPNDVNKRIEKYLLRHAFSREANGGVSVIPDEILWRTKDAFSDACGYDWIPALRDHCEAQVSNEEWEEREERYPHLTPQTREALYYRRLFEEAYPGQSHLVKRYWLPRWCDMTVAEPSAKRIGLL